MTAAKPRRRKTVDDIDAEIARLKERRKELRVRSAERFSRIALDTGLADLAITDEEIEEAFKGLTDRFRKPASDGSRPANAPAAAA